MLVILFFLISITYFSVKEPKIFIPSLLSVLALIIFHSMFLAEHHIGSIGYFISDEQVYLNIDGANQLNEGAKKDRYLWFFLTGLTSEMDFTGGLFSKIISLPLIPIIIYLLKKITRDDRVIYVFFFLPYLLFIMQTALRDGLILTLALSFIYLTSKPVKRVFLQLALLLILVYLLRPFYLPILLLSVFLAHYVVKINDKDFIFKIKTTFLSICMMIVISLVVYFLFKDKFDQYIRTLSYYYEFGMEIDRDKTSVTPSLSISYILYSIIRFIFTPLPFSLLERIFSGDITQFGYVDDFVRMINQLSVFIMISYVLINVKHIPRYFGMLKKSSAQLSFVFFVIINTVIYSVYYAGGGHSRLKISLFLGLFVLSLGVNKVKCQSKY